MITTIDTNTIEKEAKAEAKVKAEADQEREDTRSEDQVSTNHLQKEHTDPPQKKKVTKFPH
jgi:hypothetical protein